ncbi:hypothetical protein [Candidatus Nitrospira bockiana]
MGKGAVFLLVLVCCGSLCPPTGDAAQLRIRKDLVVQQADRSLVNATGRVERISEIAEKGDCELVATLRVNEIKLPVVGEFINACSTRLDPHAIQAQSEHGDVPIDGVFRIWFEFPGGRDDVFSEEHQMVETTDAQGRHAVEIHPVVRLGAQAFHDTIRAMEWVDFKAHGVPAFQRLIKRKVTIEEYTAEDGTEYVAIESKGALPNYFHLKAVLRGQAKRTPDGLWAVVDIMDKHKPLASGVRLFSIAGTKADEMLKSMKKNAEFSFWGITRFDGRKILKIVDEDSGYHIPIPLEFVLLDIHR